MLLRSLQLALLLAAMPLSTLVYAEEKPRWMSPEAGFVDEPSDTRVEEVTEHPQGGYQVELSLPKTDQSIEEILVIGKREEKPALVKPKIRFRVLNDPDSERRGIIVYLGTKQQFALRINYQDGSEQTLPASDDPFAGINR